MLIYRGVVALTAVVMGALCKTDEDVAPKPRPDLPPSDSLRIGVK